MDEKEVERVARLIHAVACEWHNTLHKTSAQTWEQCSQSFKDLHIHIARAVIADRERADVPLEITRSSQC